MPEGAEAQVLDAGGLLLLRVVKDGAEAGRFGVRPMAEERAPRPADTAIWETPYVIGSIGGFLGSVPLADAALRLFHGLLASKSAPPPTAVALPAFAAAAGGGLEVPSSKHVIPLSDGTRVVKANRRWFAFDGDVCLWHVRSPQKLIARDFEFPGPAERAIAHLASAAHELGLAIRDLQPEFAQAGYGLANGSLVKRAFPHLYRIEVTDAKGGLAWWERVEAIDRDLCWALKRERPDKRWAESCGEIRGDAVGGFVYLPGYGDHSGTSDEAFFRSAVAAVVAATRLKPDPWCCLRLGKVFEAGALADPKPGTPLATLAQGKLPTGPGTHWQIGAMTAVLLRRERATARLDFENGRPAGMAFNGESLAELAEPLAVLQSALEQTR